MRLASFVFALLVALPAPAQRVTTEFHSSSSTIVFPADAAGAVSRALVVGAYNSGVVVHDRAGNVLRRWSPAEFWGDPDPNAFYYDPRIVYDARADRWVVIALNGAGANVDLMIGASRTFDPRGEWDRYRLQTNEDCDFTRLALTRDDLIAATNILGGTILFLMPRATLYDGQPQIRRVELLGAEDFAPVSVDDGSVPNTFIALSSPSRMTLFELTHNSFATIGAYEAPFTSREVFADEAPQPNGIRIDPGLIDVQAAIYRDGRIHLVQTASRTTATSILVWQIRPFSTEYRTWVIEDPARTEWYAFPSIAVNGAGAAAIAFSVLSPSRHPSSAYVYRNAVGELSAPRTLKEGEAGSPVPNWGDYNTVVVDPIGGVHFWAVTSYGTPGAAWATWWSRIEVPSRRRAVGR